MEARYGGEERGVRKGGEERGIQIRDEVGRLGKSRERGGKEGCVWEGECDGR